jgi:hypothetical protein
MSKRAFFRCNIVWQEDRGLFGDKRSRCFFCKRLVSPMARAAAEFHFPPRGDKGNRNG